MVSPWITVDMLPNPNSPSAEMAIDYASYVLYRLTGEKYPGITRAVETYARAGDTTVSRVDGRYLIDVPISVAHPQRLYLRGTPVHVVHSVYTSDGELSPTQYALFNRRFLKLTTGNNWSYGCHSDNTGITVDYSYGALPPKAGIMAAVTLASEIQLFLDDSDGNCRIPERVRSVSREGISFDMIDPQEFLDSGRTGIWEVDLFIRTANPSRAKKPPRLLSPSDVTRYRRN